jgi:valyl-tRNA synthetase
MSAEMEKVYNAKDVEQRAYRSWEESGYFPPAGTGDVFTIVIPPPNVTGSLHMGHALDNSLQDILIRYNRMKGSRTLWIPGTDHAGIATQNVVEREMKKEGKTKEDLGRDEFLRRTWEWKKTYGGRITSQLRRLGASPDWGRERFTMDEGLSLAVRKAFVTLYKEGLIYRGKRIINWCPRCKTALSDIESEHQQTKGKLWHIKYPVDGSSEYVIVATTRPETMLGDTAVAVNPKDPRYRHLIGKFLILPLVERRIPVIKDDFVDPEFGTGAVKVTPAHDPNDFEMGMRHNLPRVNMLYTDGRVAVKHFDPSETKKIMGYEGMDRFKARDGIVEDLKAEGLLEKIEDYDTSIGSCYRCKTVVEPYLSDQWFVKVAPLAEPAIKAVEDGRIKFIPDRWTKVYIDWMVNLKDWCISRQIWWGHRIPVWYCKSPKHQAPSSKISEEDICNEIIVSEEEPKKCPKCGGAHLVQDNDVLDTWFSSSLWPFSTLGWPEKTEDLKAFYPTSVLVTGYDIITFWVSRMIMMGMKFMGDVPFRTVFIHGLIRDIHGKKMSKSLGNVIDPIDIIDRAGADALRFALISLITGQGQDMKLTEEKIIECRNFANKIWNASRFALMNCGPNTEIRALSQKDAKGLEFADRWILSRYHRAVEEVDSRLRDRDNYDFGTAARVIYDFFWGDLCDWYIEMSKDRINSSDPAVKSRGISVLLYVLEGALRLLHPFMPFITEEIWQKIKQAAPSLCDADSIMISKYPDALKEFTDRQVETDMGFLQPVITSIRNIRAQYGISPSKEVEVVIISPDGSSRRSLEGSRQHISRLARASKVDIEAGLKGKMTQAAMAAFGSNEIYVPLKGLIDVEKEKTRLVKEFEKISAELKKVIAKLSNRGFVENAKPELIEEERSQKTRLEGSAKIIGKTLDSLS